jgi:hypothetical protein
MFLNQFLIPLSKFSEQAVICLKPNLIECTTFTTTDKQSIILYTQLEVNTVLPSDVQSINLNIGNLKKLIQAFNCIDLPIVQLEIENNSISFKSETTNFKYHLKEDGIIPKAPININKIWSLQFTTDIIIPSEKIDELIKVSSFTSETNKIYLSIKNSSLMAELTDKTIPNLDSLNLFLTNEITGNLAISNLPLRFDIFKLLSSLTFKNVNLRINEKGVVVFEIRENKYLLKYITSSLLK